MNSPLPTILLWLSIIWLVGWLVLPVTHRLFANLPDGGLAASRVLWLGLATLLAFWGASLHVLPLTVSPLLLAFMALGCLLPLLREQTRQRYLAWVRENRGALIVSDLIFIAAFFAFGWIRWRHPELNEFEKPMDAMLLSGLSHTHFLPMDNPWLAGVPFTNYYYFGPLMGSLLARTFATPAPLAYNLVQPLFCAFFISALWSVCSAVTRSPWRGFFAMSMVALLSHFEPLRQIAKGGEWWPFDWWSTSRVVENTINEYPFFTLTIGDAHAHFYALALAALFFSVCYSLFTGAKSLVIEDVPVAVPDAVRKGKKRKARALEVEEVPVAVPEALEPGKPGLSRGRCARLLVLGVLLGLFVLTNTWDAPLYCLLALACALLSLPAARRWQWPEIGWALVPALMTPLVAVPYLYYFKAPVHGFVAELWQPPLVSLLLLWGVFLLMGLFILAGRCFLEAKTALTAETATDNNPDPASLFSRALFVCGVLAFVAPMLFYLNGKFGGDMRHQDTVFKFWLQSWLLLGTALACGVMRLYVALRRPGRALLSVLLVVIWFVPLLGSYSVVWCRAVRDASRDADGAAVFSIDGERFLPPDDRAAIDWLRTNARPGDVVLEATNPTNFYSYVIFGRVATFSGVPSVLGWTQHVWFWGADLDKDTGPRWDTINDIYAWRDKNTALEELHRLGVSYIFVGEEEHKRYDGAGLDRLKNDLPHVFESGETFIAVVPQ